MGQLFARTNPQNIYIQLAAEPLKDVDYSWLVSLVPGTYLASIPDPLRHIIAPMVGPEYVGMMAGWQIWHNRGEFYGGWTHPIRFQSISYCTMDSQQRILPYLHVRSRDTDLVRRYLSRGWYEARNTEPFILAVRHV